MTVIATSAAVAGLAWAVFGIGDEAEFSAYLAWVMWPVVAAFVVVVLGTWGWVAGIVEVVADEGKGTEKDGKEKKDDYMSCKAFRFRFWICSYAVLRSRDILA